MAIGLLAKKIGMTQLFNEHGRAVAVTVLQAGPCTVTQVKEPKTDGYRSIQIGFESLPAAKDAGQAGIKDSKLTKAVQGHLKKSGTGPLRYLREFRTLDGESYTLGQQLTVELFKEGELVDVTGTSIGKGFQGGMKRWHWKGGPRTHGSTSHRAPGSIGSTTFPGRVIKGHHLPGHMGFDRVTVQNLRIMKVDPQANLLIVQGAVPGPERQLLLVRKSAKKPGVVVAAKGIQELFVEIEEKTKQRAKTKK